MENNKDFVSDNEKDFNKKIKSVPKPEQGIGIDLSKKFIDNIAGGGISSKLDISVLNSFSQMSQRRDDIYRLLDMMGEDSIISAILETYAEDATETTDEGRIVYVESDDTAVGKFVTYLIDTMQIDKHIYKWVYSLCKYGDVYFQLFKESEYRKDDAIFNSKSEKKDLNEDVLVHSFKPSDKFIHYIEANPNPAEMYELTRFGKVVGYIKADVANNMHQKNSDILNRSTQFIYKYKKKDVHVYDATKFVHAALEDNSSRTPEEVRLYLDDKKAEADDGTTYIVRRGQSLLYNTFKIWRELSLLENSILLNRVTKSAIIRIINVEVGDMPKEMVGPHLAGIKSMMEQKSALNENNSLTEYTNPGPIENNIYVPTHDGTGVISTSQVGGDVQVSNLPDVDYFLNKFFGAMRVPKQYFGLTDDAAGFSGGQSLAIISSRYAKMIKRIQSVMTQAITDVINLLLIDKNLNSYINKFTIKMQAPTTQEEIDRRENVSSKVQIISDIMNLLNDVEDPIIKTKILKSLLTNVISDADVISLINDQIDKLELEAEELKEKDNNETSSPREVGDKTPLDLDNDLNLDNLVSGGPEEQDTQDSLPTPEELDNEIDFTDSTDPNL